MPTKTPTKPRNQMGWAEAVYRIVLKFITTGHGIPVILGLFTLGLAWIITHKLESKDTRELIQWMVERPFWTWLGWAPFLLTSVLFRVVYVMQRNGYEGQMKIVEGTKNRALALHEKLPLPSNKSEK